MAASTGYLEVLPMEIHDRLGLEDRLVSVEVVAGRQRPEEPGGGGVE